MSDNVNELRKLESKINTWANNINIDCNLWRDYVNPDYFWTDEERKQKTKNGLTPSPIWTSFLNIPDRYYSPIIQLTSKKTEIITKIVDIFKQYDIEHDYTTHNIKVPYYKETPHFDMIFELLQKTHPEITKFALMVDNSVLLKSLLFQKEYVETILHSIIFRLYPDLPDVSHSGKYEKLIAGMIGIS